MESANGVSVGDPKGNGIGGSWRKNDIEAETAGHFGENFGTDDRIGPWFNARKFNTAGLTLNFQICSPSRDFGVESLNAQVQSFGFRAADAVVIDTGKGSEAVENLEIIGKT